MGHKTCVEGGQKLKRRMCLYYLQLFTYNFVEKLNLLHLTIFQALCLNSYINHKICRTSKFFQSTVHTFFNFEKKKSINQKQFNGRVLLNKIYMPSYWVYPQIRSMWKLFKLFKALSRYNSYPFYQEVLKPS